jgi:hypothetical protein
MPSQIDPQSLLTIIPDFLEWEKARLWLEEGQKLMQSAPNIKKINIRVLEWSDIALPATPYFGLYSLEIWRKFAFAVYFTDLISYQNPIERESFERLLFILHAFPQGFRIWWMRIHDLWLPVGYSAWHPMLETAFEVFENSPERLKDRMVVPCKLSQDPPFIYLFNSSAAPHLNKSLLTKRLMQYFIRDIENTHYKGLACITVSKDGDRVATRLKMRHAGDFSIGDSLEGVYVKRI